MIRMNVKLNCYRCRSIGDCRAGALTPSCGRSGRSLLSDHAKSIRGEASKRIDNLLLDWKDYKKKAEEEIRYFYISSRLSRIRRSSAMKLQVID